jgi:hypothetical protein
MERLDALSVDEMVAVENVGNGIVSMKALRGIIAKFLANEQGAYYSEPEALVIIGKLLRPQFFEVIREFFASVNGLAVNP